MNIFMRLALLCLALSLLGCGKFDRLDDGGFTQITFNHGYRRLGEINNLATQNGGILIYAYSPSYVTNLKISDETQTASISLPNASYLFYAIGYDTAATPLNSNVKCAISNQVLDGTPKNITLNLTSADCANGAFVNSSNFTESTASTASNFSRMQFLFCGSGANTAVSGFSSTSRCGFSQTAYQMIAGAMSYRISAPIFYREDGTYFKLGSGIAGNCIFSSTAGEFSNSPAPRFPIGNSAVPGVFPLEVESFSSTDCSGSLYSYHNFTDGIFFGPKAGSTNQNGKLVSFSNTSIGVNTGLYFLIGN